MFIKSIAFNRNIRPVEKPTQTNNKAKNAKKHRHHTIRIRPYLIYLPPPFNIIIP